MRNFLLILVIVILIPVIWFLGIRGITWEQMIDELGISRWFVRHEN